MEYIKNTRVTTTITKSCILIINIVTIIFSMKKQQQHQNQIESI